VRARWLFAPVLLLVGYAFLADALAPTDPQELRSRGCIYERSHADRAACLAATSPRP